MPDSLMGIGNGTFTGKSKLKGNRMMYSWEQKLPVPSYTFGFAIGPFNSSVQEQNGTILNFYSSSHSVIELYSIFKETRSMMSYFEEVSGVKYYQDEYSQILIGSHFQEMANFAVQRESYGQIVLNDSTETNELAHQWWGNAITCQNWSHFWLNEASATYMSAAFNEHRFGKDKYMENINAYFDVYKGIKDKGADKPLVFEDWSNPTSDDRNIVYFKGAYVLHLLREKLGNERFWNGIKIYSQTYFGKSVVTKDFQDAMEKSTHESLNDFFDQWVYLKS